MKIGITLNEVLRDFIGQFHATYEKYKGEVEFGEEEVNSFNLLDFYDFKDKLELNEFLYRQASLEVFGHADIREENCFLILNNFIMDIEDETEHEVYLISREVNASIPSTMFFLSKVLCKAENIKFVREYEDKWDGIDVLITANPIALENKPKGKLGIKINHPYNQSVDADYEFDSLSEMLDVDIIEKLIDGYDFS
jgi:hypothetical protein